MDNKDISLNDNLQPTENLPLREDPFITVRYNHEDMNLSRENAVILAQKGLYLEKLLSRSDENSLKTLSPSHPEGGNPAACTASGENTDGGPAENEEGTPALPNESEKALKAQPEDGGLPSYHEAGPTLSLDDGETTENPDTSACDTFVDGIQEFFEKYPNILVSEINDEVLCEYAQGVPLLEAYEKHSRLSEIRNLKEELRCLKSALAVKNANEANEKSAGSPLSGGGSAASSEYYSKEELNSLSGERLEKNLDKALKSMVHWSSKKADF